MKTLSLTKIALAVAVSSFSLSSFSQTTADVFNSGTPITWMGVDFSEMRYLGDPETVDATEMKNLTQKINYLLIKEAKKYDVAASLDKNQVTTDFSLTDKVNQNMNATAIISTNQSDYTRFKPETIQSMVKGYDFGALKGVGLVFIVEALNKNVEAAAIWVTFVNMNNKSVLVTERVTGRGLGFGFRNHWAGSIHDALKQISGGLFKEWKKKYTKSEK